MKNRLKIGTRGSKLALVQADMVKRKLEASSKLTCEIVKVSSKGDRRPDEPLNKLGAGSFSGELNQQILEGNVDVGVHSCKDLPSTLEDGLVLVAVLERGPWQDLIIYKGSSGFIDNANSEAIIATGSARRKAQWLSRYPEHVCVELRGNIETRLKKLEESAWQGIIMAQVAIDRLNIKNVKYRQLSEFLPAPCQGTIALVCRKDSPHLEVLKSINAENNFIITTTERDFIRELGMNCDTPLGLLVENKGAMLELRAELFFADGKQVIRKSYTCPVGSHLEFGKNCAEDFLAAGAKEILLND